MLLSLVYLWCVLSLFPSTTADSVDCFVRLLSGTTQYNRRNTIIVCVHFSVSEKKVILFCFFFFERKQSTSTDSAFVAHSFVYDWHTTYRLIRFEMIGMFIFFLIELQFVYIRAAFDSNAMMCMMCMTSRLVAVQFFLFSLTFILF